MIFELDRKLQKKKTSITTHAVTSEAVGSSQISKSSQAYKVPTKKIPTRIKNFSALETLYPLSLFNSISLFFLCHVSQVIPTCEIKYLSSIRGARGNDGKRRREKRKQRKGKKRKYSQTIKMISTCQKYNVAVRYKTTLRN